MVNRQVSTILVTIATIMLVITLKHIVGVQILSVSIIMVVAGLLIILFGRKMLDGTPSLLKDILTHSAGMALFLSGVNLILEHYSSLYWLLYGVVGLVLLNSHNQIADRL